MATKRRPTKATTQTVKIRKGAIPHLYVREHMAAKGLDVAQMAGRLDMHEKSIYRALNEPTRVWENVQGWAQAIGLEHWQDLTRPPGEPSIDARLSQIPREFRETILKIVGGN